MAQTDITIAGVGGQGSILAGVILGTAAVTYDDKYAVQTQAYSSELRGGYAATWVIVSERPVDFPRVTAADILVAQAPDAIRRFAKTLQPKGLLIIDSDMVSATPAGIQRVFRVPATSLARNAMKAPVVANMIMLGALWQATVIVSREALEKAITDSVPRGKDKLNLEAFALGARAVEDQIK
jgi:2-oxoglutarate ferredoxin oxidoreductase subunit gamma